MPLNQPDLASRSNYRGRHIFKQPIMDCVRSRIPSDALLGIISHGTLAIGLTAQALMTWVRMDLMGLLFGDILAVSKLDVAVTYVGGAVILGILISIWRPLFAATTNPELAEAEGANPQRSNIIFTLLTASIIALSMKIVGVLLITAMLIIPAATARRMSSTPEQMGICAALLGIITVVAGLMGSLEWNTPSGPSIVIAAAILFALSLTPIARSLSITGVRRNGAKR